MKKYFTLEWIKKSLPVSIIFLIALLIILYSFPKESKNEYTYYENTPWLYGLLTAPFNFNILKSEKQIEQEKDSIYSASPVYFTLDNREFTTVYSELIKDGNRLNIPKNHVDYLVGKLKTIYNTGVISAEEIERLNKEDRKQIQLIKSDNIAASRRVNTFYTPKQAYELIVNDAPMWIDTDQLKQMNLNKYLNPNIDYDVRTTKNVIDEALRNLSLFEGEVLSGQKIIDRGEIVDATTLNILNSYVKQVSDFTSDKYSRAWSVVGICIMLVLFLSMLGMYLRIYRADIYRDVKSVTFILLMLVLFTFIASLMADMKMYNQLYIIPFTIPTILIRTFMDSRTAVITHMITIFICTLMLPLEYMAQFIVVEMLAGYTCILSLKKLVERSQLVYASIFIFITYILSYSGWIMYVNGNFDFSMLMNHREVYIFFCINLVLVSFAYSSIYIIERIFGFISEVTMIELANTSKDLLQELSETAPGTFQHSMQVSNLVVSAANKIGANAILARTGALYHDIGKMINTIFFTENQPNSINPHKYLTYHDSARIIIGHVEEGVKIAKKHKLPKQIIDFIVTHHGKSMASYFYNSYKNEHPDEEVDKRAFTYPGPNPFSKETAILMMADTVEAASRSLKENTKEAITELVNRLIDKQVKDGLFNNSPITFKDINDVKEVFCEKLISMRHVRVAYPELNKAMEEEPDKGEDDEDKIQSIK